MSETAQDQTPILETYEYVTSLPSVWALYALVLHTSAETLRSDVQIARAQQDYALLGGVVADAGGKAIEHPALLTMRSWTEPVYYMLMGLAFENLLKGMLIAQGKGVWNDDGRFKHTSHCLQTLARLCGIAIDEEQSVILDRLSKYVIWEARYPLPSNRKDLGTHLKRDRQPSLTPEQLRDLYSYVLEAYSHTGQEAASGQ
jgi:hypothetical protein